MIDHVSFFFSLQLLLEVPRREMSVFSMLTEKLSELPVLPVWAVPEVHGETWCRDFLKKVRERERDGNGRKLK